MSITDAFNTAWGMLKLDETKAKEAAQSPFVNVLVIFAVAALASAIGTLIMPSTMGFGNMGMMGGGFIVGLIGGFIGSVIGMFIWTAIVWVFIKIFGGDVGYMGLYKALGHTSLASVLSIIPVLGMIGGIWAIVASIVGVKSIANLSTGKAAAAVLLPIAIVIVLAVIFVMIIGMAFLGALAGSGSFA